MAALLAPRPEPDAPLHVVLNPASGRDDAQRTCEAVTAVLTAAGRRHAIHVPDTPGQIPQLSAELARRVRAEGGVLVAAGGDGTLAGVAQAAWAADAPLGVLPQGTFNYFARTHGIPADVAEATRLLLHGHAQPVQLGCVHGAGGPAAPGARLFLVNASLGLYPQVLEDREAFQAQRGRSRTAALLALLSTLAGPKRPMRLQLEHGGVERSLRALTLFVGNCRLQLEQLGIAEAPIVEEGELVALLLEPVRPLEMAGLVLRGALGRLGEDTRVQRFGFRRLRVAPSRLARGRVKLAMDGEVRWHEAPLSFAVAPRPLWLFKEPRPAAPGAGHAAQAQRGETAQPGLQPRPAGQPREPVTGGAAR